MNGSVRVRDVSRRFPGVAALDKVSLAVEPGEWVSVMGPSGSGKTTLLNLVGGLDLPSSGSVLVDGQEISRLGEDDRARFRRRNIGIVFQHHHLISYLTALENVMLAQHFHSTIDETEARVMLDRVGLSDRESHLPETLSGGERQRVGIARALINEPALLLGDEITGNLDGMTSNAVLDLIGELRCERPFTVILVTHDSQVASRGDRTVILEDGRLHAP